MPLPDDARLMSADDHIIESAHLWVDRVPRRYRDRCPRIVEQEGQELWLYGDPGDGVVAAGAHLLDEWCATAPGRLFGAAILPLADVDAAAVGRATTPTVTGCSPTTTSTSKRCSPAFETNFWALFER